MNKPPVAIVKPATQEVNEPNDLVIDGSGMLQLLMMLGFNLLYNPLVLLVERREKPVKVLRQWSAKVHFCRDLLEHGVTPG